MIVSKRQRGALSVVAGVITGHWVIGAHAKEKEVLGYLLNE